MTNIIDSLPLSQDLLQYYKQKIESWSIEYQNLLSKIDSNSVGDEEHHKLEWNLFSIQNDVKLLQLKLSQSTQALFEERRHVLRALADNDLLKVQELQDRVKIRYLLAIIDVSFFNLVCSTICI